MIRNLLASRSDRRDARARGALHVGAFVLVTLLAGLTATSSLRAAWLESPYIDLPQGRINRTGLRIQIDWYGARHPGYQPVRVRIVTANGVPSGRDRELDVRLYPYAYDPSYASVTVRKTIVLPKGAVSVDDVISIPINQQLSVLSTEVYEDGKSHREFAHSGYYTRQYGFEESLPSILVVGPNAPTREQFNRINQTSRFGSTAFDEFEIPEIGALSGVAAGNYYEPLYNANSNSKTIDYLTYLHTSNTQISVLHPDDLPDRWIDLTCYEVVVLGWNDLTALRAARPEAFAALRDWTLAGRTLMVYGLGDGLETLPELEKAFEVEPSDWPEDEVPADAIDAADSSSSSEKWTRPPRTLRTTNLALWASSQGYRGSYPTTMATPTVVTTQTDASSQPDEFVIATRRCRFGYVVAIGNENPYPGTPDDWRWAINSVPANHLSWSQKHGMSYGDVNVPFWRHRIPGVGVAPVWTFLALITAFVALIGPANYFYLARRKRLSLLLLTVPIGSFAVILGLFAYAFLNDGLGVRSRIRSYSIVDSQAGRTYSWSWQTYFAGVAPSQGILLDESCYYAPLFFDPNSAINSRNQFEIDWNDGQRLARGYFPSRTMSQFVANGVREGTYRLDVNFPKGGGEPEVENLLGTDLPFLVCVGPDGTLYSAPSVVEKEAKTKLVKLSATEAAEVFDRFVKASPLEIPDGVDAEALRSSQYRNGFFGWIFGDYAYYYNTAGTAPTNVNATKFEQGIQQARTSLERNVPPMEPGTYYAVAEAPPWIPYAVENHSREMNLDVVYGRYE